MSGEIIDDQWEHRSGALQGREGLGPDRQSVDMGNTLDAAAMDVDRQSEAERLLPWRNRTLEEIEARFQDATTIPDVCERNVCYAPNNAELGYLGLVLLERLAALQAQVEQGASYRDELLAQARNDYRELNRLRAQVEQGARREAALRKAITKHAVYCTQPGDLRRALSEQSESSG